MGKGKKWTAEEKFGIIMEGMKGRSPRELCREYGVSEGQYYKWRDEALSGMKDGLKDKRKKEWRDQSWEVEKNRLLKKVGEQQMIIDLQKKIADSY